MAGERRRLAAILAADVVGASRLMAEDEPAAIAAIARLRREVLEPRIAEHHGRLFKAMGDGFLAEFPSAVEALRCALAVQEAQRSGGLALALRIGVHQGDVVVAEDGSDLLGDGVNVAVRLEGLAEPGGVAVSARVREDASGKLDVGFDDLGERELRNIPRPVHAFRARAGHAAPATTERRAPPLPDQPSLAVLPFQNMSGDPEQEYFVDGLVEDIATALSRIRWFFVVARNSAFTYKGRAVDVRQVGRELGVRYVVEGSARRAGGRLRITAQLVEAESGRHVWADRFEGAAEDVFDLQDRFTEAVAAAIEPSLQAAEVRRAQARPTWDLGAYELYLRALPCFRAVTREGSDAALGLLRRAIARDPAFALARAFAAKCLQRRQVHGWSAPGEAEEAIALARSVLDAPPDDATTLGQAGITLLLLGVDRDRAVAALERAFRDCPNSASLVDDLAWALTYEGEAARALALFERAIRLSPRDPDIANFLAGQASAHLVERRFEEALRSGRDAVALQPAYAGGHRTVITALHHLGRADEARAAAERFRRAAPGGARVLAEVARRPWRDPSRAELFIAALRAAGLPE